MFGQKVNDGPGRAPDFSAKEGVVVWTNQDKNGNPYLSIKIPLLGISVNAFKVEPKVPIGGVSE